MLHLTSPERPTRAARFCEPRTEAGSVALVVPAYNEERNLTRLFAQLHRVAPSLGLTGPVVVVDDGSLDGTPAVIRRYDGPLRLEPVRHEVNLGLGRALETGLRRAVAHSEVSWVVTMEADTTSDLTALGPMLRAGRAGADVVQASNHHPAGALRGAPWPRRVASRGASTVLRAASGLSLHTFTNLYRCLRAATVREALARQGDRLITRSGFAGVTELLLRLARGGAAVVEVPTTLDASRRRGASSMRVLPTALDQLGLAAWALGGRVAGAR
jgi:dolichol-phosphate mannosyltransferase